MKWFDLALIFTKENNFLLFYSRITFRFCCCIFCISCLRRSTFSPDWEMNQWVVWRTSAACKLLWYRLPSLGKIIHIFIFFFIKSCTCGDILHITYMLDVEKFQILHICHRHTEIWKFSTWWILSTDSRGFTGDKYELWYCIASTYPCSSSH